MFKGKRFTPAMIVAMIALAVALSGTAVAGTAKLITGSQIANGTIKLAHLNKTTKAALKGDRGATGPQGAVGAQGAQGLTGAKGDTGATGAKGAPGTDGINGKDGKDGKDAPTMLRLAGDFAGTNASVATTLDGVQFGPYPDSSWGGSVKFNGLNGRKLDSITQLSYTVMHSTLDDSPISSPYLRVFLTNGKDVVFDATQCATTVPAEDVFNTYEVTTATKLRYDDDACGAAYDPQTWAEVVADHGSEVISGIYVTTGFSGGAPISALLRTLKVNGTEYTFGAA